MDCPAKDLVTRPTRWALLPPSILALIYCFLVPNGLSWSSPRQALISDRVRTSIDFMFLIIRDLQRLWDDLADNWLQGPRVSWAQFRFITSVLETILCPPTLVLLKWVFGTVQTPPELALLAEKRISSRANELTIMLALKAAVDKLDWTWQHEGALMSALRILAPYSRDSLNFAAINRSCTYTQRMAHLRPLTFLIFTDSAQVHWRIQVPTLANGIFPAFLASWLRVYLTTHLSATGLMIECLFHATTTLNTCNWTAWHMGRDIPLDPISPSSSGCRPLMSIEQTGYGMEWTHLEGYYIRLDSDLPIRCGSLVEKLMQFTWHVDGRVRLSEVSLNLAIWKRIGTFAGTLPSYQVSLAYTWLLPFLLHLVPLLEDRIGDPLPISRCVHLLVHLFSLAHLCVQVLEGTGLSVLRAAQQTLLYMRTLFALVRNRVITSHSALLAGTGFFKGLLSRFLAHSYCTVGFQSHGASVKELQDFLLVNCMISGICKLPILQTTLHICRVRNKNCWERRTGPPMWQHWKGSPGMLVALHCCPVCSTFCSNELEASALAPHVFVIDMCFCATPYVAFSP